jgi:hypothetical protein
MQSVTAYFTVLTPNFLGELRVIRDSDHKRPDYDSGALTTELRRSACDM